MVIARRGRGENLALGVQRARGIGARLLLPWDTGVLLGGEKEKESVLGIDRLLDMCV